MEKKEIHQWKKILLEDLESVATELKSLIDQRAVIIFEGEVGVGKTTFTQKLIGMSASPTYSLIHEVGDCVHADFYRLDDDEEIIDLDIELYLEDKKIVVIEWGMKHIQALTRFIDDHYPVFLLEIERPDNQQEYRNFSLSKLLL